jgi:hypothetical protein
MKRIVTIVLLICYMIPGLGLSVSAHYCGGKLKSMNLSLSGTNKCCGAKKMKPGCCKDKVCKFKTGDSRKASLFVPLTPFQAKSFAPSPCLIASDLFSTANSNQEYLQWNSPPPLVLKEPLYLTNRVFRI